MDTAALWLTLRLAAETTVLLLAIALPVAWWLARGTGAVRTLVEALVALPLVLPPTVIGFYLLVGLGPLSPLGRVVARVLGHPLVFRFGGLLVGSMVFSLPFAVQPLVAGFRAVPRDLLEASAGLGAGSLKTLVQVVLPLSHASLLAAAVLAFTHTVGEFGIVLMIGGNLPGLTRTVSIALYDQVEDMNYTAANRTSVGLIAVSLAALLLIYARRRTDAA